MDKKLAVIVMPISTLQMHYEAALCSWYSCWAIGWRVVAWTLRSAFVDSKRECDSLTQDALSNKSSLSE
jgi:hypothetical protein